MSAELATYKVLVSAPLFERLVDRVDWGEPDEDGFYTPTLYSGKVTEAIELGLAWQEAEAALPEGWVIEFGNYTRRDSHWAYAFGPEEKGQHATEKGYGPTPAEALRALAAKLREGVTA